MADTVSTVSSLSSPEDLERVRAVLRSKQPTLDDIMAVTHTANLELQAASQKFVRLRDTRRTVLVNGTPEEIAKWDEEMEATKREEDRWTAVVQELRRIEQGAVERERMKQAEEAVKELPAELVRYENARQAVDAGLRRLIELASVLQLAKDRRPPLSEDLRERLEAAVGRQHMPMRIPAEVPPQPLAVLVEPQRVKGPAARYMMGEEEAKAFTEQQQQAVSGSHFDTRAYLLEARERRRRINS